MAKVYLNDSILTAISNAIKTQTNNPMTLLPSEMPAAINSIGNTTTFSMLTTRADREWSGWENASWDDIKFAVDGLLKYPKEDITIGKIKLADGLVFELVDMVDGILVFKSASTHQIEPNLLALDELWMNSEVLHQVTNDKFFLPLDEWDKELDGYHLMFAIGLHELGPEYTGRKEEIDDEYPEDKE